LLDVVRFYNQGGQKNPNLNNKIHPLDLNENEINQLVEFLRSLTSDDVLRQVQTSTPQTRTAVAYWQDHGFVLESLCFYNKPHA